MPTLDVLARMMVEVAQDHLARFVLPKLTRSLCLAHTVCTP